MTDSTKPIFIGRGWLCGVVLLPLLLATFLWLNLSHLPITGNGVAGDSNAEKELSTSGIEQTGNRKKEAAENLSQSAAAGPLPELRNTIAQEPDLWSAFEAARRLVEVNRDKGSFVAWNPKQDLRAVFSGNETSITPGRGSKHWEFTMRTNLGQHAKSQRAAGHKVEYDYGSGFVEWFVNHSEGIEHGFTLAQPMLEEKEGWQQIPITLKGLSAVRVDERNLHFVDSVGEAILAYSNLKVWDASGEPLAAGMYPTEGGFEIAFQATGARFPITVDPLITRLESKLKPRVTGSGVSDDRFGTAVSIDGDTALIGAPGDDTAGGPHSGRAFVFKQIDGDWHLEQRLEAAIPKRMGNFGAAVALEGDTALVGAPLDNELGTEAGATFVYKRTSGGWRQSAKLLASDGMLWDNFGIAVALSGHRILVGASNNVASNADPGKAYVFTEINGLWQQTAKLRHPDGATFDFFGSALDLEGDTAVVGAFGRDDPQYGMGAAYVFEFENGAWHFKQELTADDEDRNHFGQSVALSGNTILVGSPRIDGFGRVLVYERLGDAWTLSARLEAEEKRLLEQFGISVAIDGDKAVIGSDETISDNSIYAAYVFLRQNGVWQQTDRITASAGIRHESYGTTVSISGNVAIVGSPRSDDNGGQSGAAFIYELATNTTPVETRISAGNSGFENAFGLALDLHDDRALIGSISDGIYGANAGAAYIFQRLGGTWQLESRLTAPDADSFDFFGSAVSLDGNLALIGAPGDDAIKKDSGSAYTFARGPQGWSFQSKLTAFDGWESDHFGNAVSLDGDRALIGAYSDYANAVDSGSAYVLRRENGHWISEAKLYLPDGAISDQFGYSVSLSGQHALIGAPQFEEEGFNTGGAFVYKRNQNEWSLLKRLLPTGLSDWDEFGRSVSMEAGRALVGAPGDDETRFNSGAAYVYDVATRTIATKLRSPQSETGARLGTSVAVSEGSFLVGAPTAGLAGSAYLFADDPSSWSDPIALKPADGNQGDAFGDSVAIDGNTLLIGSRSADGLDTFGDTVPNSGAVYVYYFSDLGADTDGDGASDQWEAAHGFDPNNASDISSRDRDGDGVPDFMEIFHGTDPQNSASVYRMQPVSVDREGVLKFRYRKSSSDTSISVRYTWSTTLSDWHSPGASENGTWVEIWADVVQSGDGYQILEVSARPRGAATKNLFVRMELTTID